MVRTITYDRQTVGSRNPAKRMAHRSRLRRAVSLAEQQLPVNGALLDFGAGPGKFLSDLKLQRPDVDVIGYDKFQKPTYDGLRYVTGISDLPDESIDVLTAFEVLEHLIDNDIDCFLRDARRLLKDRGSLIISVPIMYGPIVVLKEASQMIAFQRSFDYSLSEFARVLVGSTIPRPPTTDRFKTHKGFDFRTLRARIASEFTIENEVLSPFPSLPWICNSQIFLVARNRPHPGARSSR